MHETEVLIVGCGFGGIGMGWQLKQAGSHDFVILEKSDEVGGTWRENTYPGAECDVPSSLYSYSFAPNPDWKHKWSKQEQIFAYQKKCVEDFQLRPHIRFNQRVKSAAFDATRGRWIVNTESGDVYDCRHFISALGQLHHPNVPKFTGQTEFTGPQFHSAEWQHDVDLNGKRVAVIGNAASAIQFIPFVAEQAAQLTIYQRSANWILAKGDRPYSPFEKWVARNVPLLAKLYRLGVWAKGEYILYPMIAGSKAHQRLGRWMFRNNLNKKVSNPELREKLTPDYPIGAKRVLLSDAFYPALARDNVKVVTEGIDRFSSTGVIDRSGTTREHDVVIYATGFQTNPFLQSIEVTGREGQRLCETWKDGARAYYGVAVPGFPNLHILYGPNTNTGHTSVIFFMEAQAQYIMQLIHNAGAGTVEVRADTAADFDSEVQSRLGNTAWEKVEKSWYKDGDRITNNWPGSSREYARRIRRANLADFNWGTVSR